MVWMGLDTLGVLEETSWPWTRLGPLADDTWLPVNPGFTNYLIETAPCLAFWRTLGNHVFQRCTLQPGSTLSQAKAYARGDTEFESEKLRISPVIGRGLRGGDHESMRRDINCNRSRMRR